MDGGKPTLTIILGIDPGASGGLALDIVNGTLGDARVAASIGDRARKMPETERDVWAWFEGAKNGYAGGLFAIIEHVHSMPKQGVSSSFKFGRSYGFLRGCLIASGIPFEEVSPQTWQKALGCRSGGDKNVTKRRAQQLFPNLKITHATADALLLAEYGRRLWIARNQIATPGTSNEAPPARAPLLFGDG